MEQPKKVKVRIQIAREDDREKVGGILIKNGIAVAPMKDYRLTKDGKKSNSLQYFLVVEAEAVDD